MGALPAATDLVLIKPVGELEAVVLGSEVAIGAVGESAGSLPPSFLRAAVAAMTSAPEMAEAASTLTGRVVKLTDDSVALIRDHGLAMKEGVFAGVTRNADGTIAGHLTFVDPGQLATLAASLPALAGAVAMQIQLARIERQLDEIKVSVEYLIDLAHDETIAEIAADLKVLGDAYDAAQKLDEVDDDHWDLVANVAQPVRKLHDLTGRRLRSLHQALSEDGASLPTRVRRLSRALRRDRTLFWLEAHVHAELALTRWECLYLMRQADQHPETLVETATRIGAEQDQRVAELRELANSIARYLQVDSRLNSLLDRIRLISRFRLDRLLEELDELLGVYRHALGAAGTPVPALKPGEQPLAEITTGSTAEDHEWRELMRKLKTPLERVQPIARTAIDGPKKVANAVSDRFKR
jgi:hypothetical protein